MSRNPYLKLQSNHNPYLEAAMSREADARMIQKLVQLVPNDVLPYVSPEQATTSSSTPESVYQSALETPAPSSLDLKRNNPVNSSESTSEGQTAAAYSSDPVDDGAIPLATGTDAVRDSPGADLHPRRPYRSPDVILREEAAAKQREQQRLRQEAIRQQQLQREQERQAAAQRRQLELRAEAFLKTIDALDPLDGERLWFESFAELCASRLEAAMELVAAVPKDMDRVEEKG